MVTSYMSTAVFLPISGNNRNAKNDAIKRQDSIVFLYTILDNIFLRDFCTYFYIFPRDFSFLQKNSPDAIEIMDSIKGFFIFYRGIMPRQLLYFCST